MSFILPCLPPTPSGIPKTGVRFVQDIVQRVGSKGPMGEFARALCAQLTPQLITVQHLAELLKLAQEEDNPPDEVFLDAVLRLLADTALAGPRMLASLEPQVPGLLHSELLPSNRAAVGMHIQKSQEAGLNPYRARCSCIFISYPSGNPEVEGLASADLPCCCRSLSFWAAATGAWWRQQPS